MKKLNPRQIGAAEASKALVAQAGEGLSKAGQAIVNAGPPTGRAIKVAAFAVGRWGKGVGAAIAGKGASK